MVPKHDFIMNYVSTDHHSLKNYWNDISFIKKNHLKDISFINLTLWAFLIMKRFIFSFCNNLNKHNASTAVHWHSNRVWSEEVNSYCFKETEYPITLYCLYYIWKFFAFSLFWKKITDIFDEKVKHWIMFYDYALSYIHLQNHNLHTIYGVATRAFNSWSLSRVRVLNRWKYQTFLPILKMLSHSLVRFTQKSLP